MEKFAWTDRVRNEEVFHIVKKERSILHTYSVLRKLQMLVPPVKRKAGN